MSGDDSKTGAPQERMSIAQAAGAFFRIAIMEFRSYCAKNYPGQQIPKGLLLLPDEGAPASYTIEELSPNPVKVLYTDYKGEKAHRVVHPLRLRIGSTEFHAERQWLLEVHDMGKGAARTYAFKDIEEVAQ